MNSWTHESMKALLDRYAGPEDATDPKARKRSRIVQAAIGLFTQQGYRKTSMDEVARRAGVAKGTVYLYFKNKADLLMAAIADEKRRYLHLIADLMRPEVSGRERLRRFLALGFTASQELPMLSRLLSGDREILVALDELDAESRDQIESLREEHFGFLVRDAVDGESPGDAILVDQTRVLMGLLYCSGAFADERVRLGLSLERFAEVLADALVDGVGRPRREADDEPDNRSDR